MLVLINNKALFTAYLKEQNSRTDIVRNTFVHDDKKTHRTISATDTDGVVLFKCTAFFTNKSVLKTNSLHEMYVDDKEFRKYCS